MKLQRIIPFLFLTLFISSCANNADYWGNNTEPLTVSQDAANLPFLDIDTAVFTMSFEGLEPFERQTLIKETLTIFRQAQDRINPYYYVRNGRYDISVSSGDEIAISDRLFAYLLQKKDMLNESISNGDYIIIDGKMVPTYFPELDETIDITLFSFNLLSGDENNNDDYLQYITEYGTFGYQRIQHETELGTTEIKKFKRDELFDIYGDGIDILEAMTNFIAYFDNTNLKQYMPSFGHALNVAGISLDACQAIIILVESDGDLSAGEILTVVASACDLAGLVVAFIPCVNVITPYLSATSFVCGLMANWIPYNIPKLIEIQNEDGSVTRIHFMPYSLQTT